MTSEAKKSRFQFTLILAVIFLTIYNILPTVFYYSKPLNQPITSSDAKEIITSIEKRVDTMQENSIDWVASYAKHLGLKQKSIAIAPENPAFVEVEFKNDDDAKIFYSHINRAGSLIPFVPAQLSLSQSQSTDFLERKVILQRRIPITFSQKENGSYFTFSDKIDASGKPTAAWKNVVYNRSIPLAEILGGESENAGHLYAISKLYGNPSAAHEIQRRVFDLAQNITAFSDTFGKNSPIARHYFATFTQTQSGNKAELIHKFSEALRATKDQVRLTRIALEKEVKGNSAKQSELNSIQAKEKLLSRAETVIEKNKAYFSGGKRPWTHSFLTAHFNPENEAVSGNQHQTLFFEGRSPFFDKLSIDWNKGTINLSVSQEFTAFKNGLPSTAEGLKKRDRADQFLYDAVAHFSRVLEEEIKPVDAHYEIALSSLADSHSFISLNLAQVAEKESAQIAHFINTKWNPTHADFARSDFPTRSFKEYSNLPVQEKQLGLVTYAPAAEKGELLKGFNSGAIYVIVKGGERIYQRATSNGGKSGKESFIEDFTALQSILSQSGFYGVRASSFDLDPEFAGDFIFIKDNYFQDLIRATRENFKLSGSKKEAILELSNYEQRLLTQNQIDNRIHEDLLKQEEDYHAAKLGSKGLVYSDVPPPIANPLISNMKLSAKKYFRGDDRKVLNWGLDLSGGKTVQIELRDTNNRVVTADADIKQAINELYNRVNKMGVSEVNIRREGNLVTLDFPGSQSLSASDLVKASSMKFHIVNEKFSQYHQPLSDATEKFLQEVWNKAVVQGRKDIEDINQIALQQLYGDSQNGEEARPRTESAKTLYENGLRLANTDTDIATSSFDNNLSKIAILRGDDVTEWHGSTHPLHIVFNNFALEGASLENIMASFDPTQGNFLSFGVRGSSQNEGIKFNPRDDFFAWTSKYSKESIQDSEFGSYTGGRGWRMAVILNGQMISAPNLDSPLREAARITGSFTQREIATLEADLKAGSLSFTPRILSEKNVSPELGSSERTQAIFATALSLVLVMGIMISYYRFSGVVASIAVIFNLLIIWAALQNIGATITLAGIAGIILTMGMAVDANVLVFERIREEFNQSKNGPIASAISIGYKKAFSAIVDSNLTTIIAALILLNFDSGPIKGFAVTLIIGIASSMFTALYMTRFFFERWAKRPGKKALSMANWIKPSKFNFLKKARFATALSLVVIVAGAYCLVAKRQNVMGMDFTGGFALNVELQTKHEDTYRSDVEKALTQKGLSKHDFEVRQLSPANNIRLFLSRNIEQKLSLEENELSQVTENPKIAWIVKTLEEGNVPIAKSSLENIDANWTDVSGQMSESMRNNAIAGLALALLCILIYITLRFEFKYAISATICIAHDVFIALAAIGILYYLRVPVQIDLHTVAAIMTIVGYSLNDTIIVFDRIREEVDKGGKDNFPEIINRAVNTTLSRTLMTSITTLFVIIPLVLFGGGTIFGFSLVMGIGVVFGTLSSLFIAAPLIHFFHNLELKRIGK